MTKKTSAARTEAFFKALSETGNQTISCERARVSRSWMTLHRSTDPVFKARMEATISEARARLSGAAEQGPADAGWADIDGEELVVRGSGGNGGGRRVQVARARLNQWTPRVEARFLRALAASCNVKAACAAVGMTAASAYVRRQRWAAFRKRWDEALDIGYFRVEAALIENACNFLDGEVEFEPAAPMPPMTVDGAIKLLRLHERRVRQGHHGVHRRTPRADIEAVKAEIVRKAAVLDRAAALRHEPLPDFLDGDGS